LPNLTFYEIIYIMKRHIEQQTPLQTYTSLDYMRGLSDALSRRGSVINTLLGIRGEGGFLNRDTSPKTTVARLKLPYDKHYDGDPFAQPYAGDYLLDLVDIDMPRPRHARHLYAIHRASSFVVQRVRLGLTATTGESDSSTVTQDFHVNHEGVLYPSGGLSLWLHPEIEVGYVPVKDGDAEPPTAPNAAVLAPAPTLPPLEVGAELLRV
jgi:hypothetical protein